MLEILLLSLYIGLASATVNIITRSAPFVERWMLRGYRPWVCDVCMTFWTSLGLTSYLFFFQNEKQAPLAWLPAYAIGKWALGKLSEPLSAPPALPSDTHGPMEPFDPESSGKRFVDVEDLRSAEDLRPTEEKIE
jgi:hypothetical protein